MRRLVTFSIEVYGDTEAEVRKNAEYIQEYTKEWVSDLGEYGDGYSTKVVSIDDTPCPPTEEELEDERDAAAIRAHVAQRRTPGEFVRIERPGLAPIHARVDADDGQHLSLTVREERSTLTVDRVAVQDITTWNPICGHGVNHLTGDCTACGERVKLFLHGLMRSVL